MPTELEELMGFIAHANPQIRLAANEALVPYSLSEPLVFKNKELKPIKDLKLLIRDHPKISEHALTSLLNLSGDKVVLECLSEDETFVDAVLSRIVNHEEPNANLLAMLLANLSKHDGFANSLLTKKQAAPENLGQPSSELVVDQLADVFVKGMDGTYNPKADYDYLAYLFADLAKHAPARQHLLTRQNYDDAYPLAKLKVFTEHQSDVRRRGVASALKNVAFEQGSHMSVLLAEDEADVLPYVLLPIVGSEAYDDEDMDGMLPDLQLLPPDKERDKDVGIVRTHLETLLLLTTTREGRDLLRAIKVYPVVRETHLRVNDEDVKEACERLVNVLMADEEDAPRVTEVDEVDEEDELVEV